MEQMIRDYGLFIVYCLAVAWMLWMILSIPRTFKHPKIIAGEAPSLWTMPGWYVLLTILVVIGWIIFLLCEVAR